MIKLLPTLVLALCAIPASAQTVQGGHLYIQDLDAPVQITYEPSFATHTTYLYIGTIDVNGNYVDYWDLLLKSTGTPNDTASIGSCLTCLMNSNTYTFTPGEGAVELVFYWSNSTINKSYYSDAVNRGRNPTDSTRNKWESVTYYSGNTARLGLEDGGGKGQAGWLTDWDWNDVVITLTNVGSTLPPPPVVPEPETYAMLLAGLGLVGAVVRRRRIG